MSSPSRGSGHYNNTLDRPSDSQGKGHWLGKLASGMARGEIVEAFAQSEEHVEIVLSGGGTTGGTDDVLI